MTDRPDYCCGVCPEIVGGGYDCTCLNNPRCPKYLEPGTPSRHVHEKWQLQESSKGGKYCAACGEDVKEEE